MSEKEDKVAIEKDTLIPGQSRSAHSETDSILSSYWSEKFEFYVYTIGYSIGILPLTLVRYSFYDGGSAFWIPYFVSMTLVGFPMLYLELSLGQLRQSNWVGVWKICPMFKGLGWLAVFQCFKTAQFYMLIICYFVYYLLSSFQSELPWSTCDNSWNTEMCIDLKALPNKTKQYDMQYTKFSSEEYFNSVTGIAFGDSYKIRMDLSLISLFLYIILFFVLFRGVKSIGKASHALLKIPLVLLLILLIRGLTLPGSADGLKYLVYPNFSHLLSISTWRNAIFCVVFSLGIGCGVYSSYSSHLDKNNSVFNDTCIIIGCHIGISLIIACVVSSFGGYISFVTNMEINQILPTSPLEILTLYLPNAFSTLSMPYLWSVFAFLTFVFLALSSIIGILFVITSFVKEEFTIISKLKFGGEIVTALVLIVTFGFGLIFCTNSGMLIMPIYDGGVWIFINVFLTTYAITRIHGYPKYLRELQGLGFRKWLVILIQILMSFCLLLIVFCLIDYFPTPSFKDFVYPTWAVALYHILDSGISVLLVILGFIVALCKYRGISCRDRFRLAVSPEEEKDAILNGTCEPAISFTSNQSTFCLFLRINRRFIFGF